jgi:neutral ceramidase
VIGGWTANGELAGCVVNYACHATTNPGGISANWVYYLEKTLRGVFGPQVVVVFAQGFCGDITQVDNRNPHRQPAGEQWARLVGGRVGAEAVKVLLSAVPGPVSRVDSRTRVWQAPRRVPSPERVKRSLELVAQDPKTVGQTEWTFAKEIVLLDAMLAKQKAVEVEVQAVQVGPAAFISAPGEMFCQLGLDLKAGSPFRFTFPTELANGSVGYVPTEEAFSKNGGGYETRLTSYSNLEITAGTGMVAAGLDLLKSLEPAAAPEAPRAVPFNPDPTGKGPHPWNYGNVPPELS